MSTINKLNYLSTTKNDLKTVINYSGANLTTDTFRNYPKKLYSKYLDMITYGTDDLYASMPKVVGEGASPTLNNTLEAPMKINLKGNTSQYSTPTPDTPQDIYVVKGNNTITTCGKNLFPSSKVRTDKSWMTVNNDGSLTIVYASGSNINYTDLFTNNIDIPVGNYKLKMFVEGTFIGGNLIIKNASGTRITQGPITNNQVLTVTNNSINNIELYQVSAGTNCTVKIELEVGTTTPESYIQYQGRDYSINLPVENLINSSTNIDGYYISSKGTVTAETGSNYTALIPIEQATYTLSGIHNRTTSNNKRIHGYDSNGDWVAQVDYISFNTQYARYSKTFTVSNPNIKYIKVSYYDDDSEVQLEKGSKANHYTPYGTTPIELCKIGDYQDYISKYEDTIKVPSEYQQVEYIESSGTQYINTGISPTANTGFKIKASLITENNTDKILIGSRVRSNRFWLDFDGTQSPPNFMYGFGSYYMAGNYSTNTDYEISFNYNGTKKIIVNNTSYDMSGTYDSTGSVPIYIFRANYSTSYAGNFKVYYCQIYEGTTLVRDLIPCIRKSDNTVGMYDLVSKIFFANAGTGTFDYGREVGSWYKYSAIGKVVLDGTNNAFASKSGTTNNIMYSTSAISNIKRPSGGSVVSSFLSTHNISKAPNTLYLNNTLGTGINTDGSIAYAFGLSSTLTTKELANTWLSTNNVTCYYPLATPTYTQITDTDLIGQLNDLEGARSYNNQTSLSQINNDEPFILNTSAIQQYQS